jgi:hypothetical protein
VKTKLIRFVLAAAAAFIAFKFAIWGSVLVMVSFWKDSVPFFFFPGAALLAAAAWISYRIYRAYYPINVIDAFLARAQHHAPAPTSPFAASPLTGQAPQLTPRP